MGQPRGATNGYDRLPFSLNVKTEEKHQKGRERKIRDKKGGEKWDKRRPY